MLDVPIERSSVYRMVIRYTNPNPEPYVGEVSVVRSDGQGDAHPQAHQVMKKCSKMTSQIYCWGLTNFLGIHWPNAYFGCAVNFQVLLQPTGGEPQFVTVSGDKGIYASPFDLEPGTWTTGVKINNDDPGAQEILVVSN